MTLIETKRIVSLVLVGTLVLASGALAAVGINDRTPSALVNDGNEREPPLHQPGEGEEGNLAGPVQGASGDDPEPYTLTYEFEGVLSCGLGVNAGPVGIAGDLCFMEDWSPHGWMPTSPRFEAPAGTQAVTLELEWTPNAQFGAPVLSLFTHEALEAEPYTAQESGPSVLSMSILSTQGGLAEDRELRAQPTYAYNSGLVIDQPWTLRVTVYVHQGLP